MQYNPHDYQKYAISYIESHPVSAIFLSMGLGKTSIALTAISNLLFDYFDAHKVLVVGPLRVARDIWPAEIQKWNHLSELIVSVAVGDTSQRIQALEAAADIYIINRENVQWLIDESGLPFDYDTVIIDELSSFKNHQAKRFKSLMKVRSKIKRIIGLTGTPSSNGLMDLWAQFKLLDMGARLGRFITSFRDSYFMPDKRNGQIIYSYKPLPGAEQSIYKKISDITISMKSTDYLQMPALISTEYTVTLSDKERDHYNALARNLVLELPDAEVTAANAAALSNKLCQMANGVIYNDDGESHIIHNQKLDALEDIIESAGGKPILVGYWYKHDYERIVKKLDELQISFSKLDTSESICKWNNKELTVGLIHPASAGHGLNLQAGGSCIVWFSLTWSLELYLQTNARLWRQGQTSETVVIHHIVCKDTVDEDVMKALAGKEAGQNALINAVRARIGERST